jgi:hypothetical protein
MKIGYGKSFLGRSLLKNKTIGEVQWKLEDSHFP